MKIISLNIERRRHWKRIIPFFLHEQPDVLCLQEVVAEDVPRIATTLRMTAWRFVADGVVMVESLDDPNVRVTATTGIAILACQPFVDEGSLYYYMPSDGIALEDDGIDKSLTNAQALLWASFHEPDGEYTIATTHFTWTHDGYPNAKQEKDFAAITALLKTLPHHVLVGDLNAPRGRGMWERFASLYGRDHIPPHITSTIDPILHRKKGLALVVDALFSHSIYRAEDVRITSGVSDHCAVSAMIRREASGTP